MLHHDPSRPLLLAEEPRGPREDPVEERPRADERGDVDPALMGQRRLAVLIGAVADGVEEDVPGIVAAGEILLFVVDRLPRSQGLDEFEVPAAGDARHPRSQGGGDLDGEVPHPAGGAVDQRPLARGQLPLVAQRLEGREAGHRQRRRLLEGERRRLDRERRLPRQRQLGVGAPLAQEVDPAVDGVARLEAGHLGTDGVDLAGRVMAEDQRELRGHDQPQAPLADHPVDRIDARRPHAQADLPRPRLPRLRDLPHLETVAAAVAVDHRRFHPACLLLPRPGINARAGTSPDAPTDAPAPRRVQYRVCTSLLRAARSPVLSSSSRLPPPPPTPGTCSESPTPPASTTSRARTISTRGRTASSSWGAG